MMQDRVLQVLQLLQHEFIGTDVILNDSSISGYESMGFNIKSMTQTFSGDNSR